MITVFRVFVIDSMALDSLPGAELSDEAALAFARGEAVPWEGRGYLVARWRGMPLGWGKASDGLLKNRSPLIPEGLQTNRGLRQKRLRM